MLRVLASINFILWLLSIILGLFAFFSMNPFTGLFVIFFGVLYLNIASGIRNRTSFGLKGGRTIGLLAMILSLLNFIPVGGMNISAGIFSLIYGILMVATLTSPKYRKEFTDSETHWETGFWILFFILIILNVLFFAPVNRVTGVDSIQKYGMPYLARYVNADPGNTTGAIQLLASYPL